jgi:hypothetical protein
MFHRSLIAGVACLFLALTALGEAVPMVTTHGKVTKADKETLTVQPRDESGKFGKAIALKLTGTSRITTLTPQMRDKKLVLTQKETDAKDLTAGQIVAIIYAAPKGQDPVLLSAVVLPPDEK